MREVLEAVKNKWERSSLRRLKLKMSFHLSKKTGEVKFKQCFMAKAVANKLCRASYFVYCFPCQPRWVLGELIGVGQLQGFKASGKLWRWVGFCPKGLPLSPLEHREISWRSQLSVASPWLAVIEDVFNVLS